MDSARKPPRILIVDESRITRATLIKHIHEHYDFREEINGEAGWQALVLDHSIQLVICALSMPMLDGDGLLARLRSSRLARLRRMPVLMIAGEHADSNQRARELGASDLIDRNIAGSELLARIASLRQLVEAQNELRERPGLHPETGLPTRQQVESLAGQAWSHALRHSTSASILVMGFDDFAALRAQHGDQVVRKLQMRFVTLLTEKMRKEDTLGHYSDSELAIVSPGTPYPACEAFANRLREAIAVANIAVHGHRLDLSVSIGVANTPVDRVASATSLLGLAGDRLMAARQAGGNRVRAGDDKPPTETPVPRLSHAIDLIRSGHAHAVIPHLALLGKEILPFLELLERELKLGLPLADIRERMRDREQEGQDTRRA